MERKASSKRTRVLDAKEREKYHQQGKSNQKPTSQDRSGHKTQRYEEKRNRANRTFLLGTYDWSFQSKNTPFASFGKSVGDNFGRRKKYLKEWKKVITWEKGMELHFLKKIKPQEDVSRNDSDWCGMISNKTFFICLSFLFHQSCVLLFFPLSHFPEAPKGFGIQSLLRVVGLFLVPRNKD